MGPKVLGAVFVGGALGTLARFGILATVESFDFAQLSQELVATSIVNLFGAWLLGFVHGIGSSRSENWKGFWGPGIAGGFTTMSGLALITAGAELGLSGESYLYWLAVSVQLALGVLAYWWGKQIADSKNAKVAS